MKFGIRMAVGRARQRCYSSLQFCGAGLPGWWSAGDWACRDVHRIYATAFPARLGDRFFTDCAGERVYVRRFIDTVWLATGEKRGATDPVEALARE